MTRCIFKAAGASPGLAALALLLALAATTQPAGATGAMACTVDDPRLELNIEGAYGHGMGGALVTAGGKAMVRLRGTPAPLAASDFERSHVAQYWLSGKELKLVLYRETEGEPHGSVEISIETRRAGRDETAYAGTYRLLVETMEGSTDGAVRRIEGKGKVTCSAG